MTIVEFYDSSAIDNLINCMVLQPERIIFIGDKKTMQANDRIHREFAASVGSPTAFVYRSVKRHSLTDIVEVLSEIVQTEPECVFDVTGGEDLTLAGMGIVYERYHRTRAIRMQRFHIPSGKARDVFTNEEIPLKAPPVLTVEQSVLPYGARAAGSSDGDRLSSWEFTPELIGQLDTLWSICRRNPAWWNFRVSALSTFEEYQHATGPLRVVIDIPTLHQEVEGAQDKLQAVESLLCTLERNGLVTWERSRDVDVLDYTYCSTAVRRLLSQAGTLLEVLTLYAATTARKPDGTPRFTDCRQSVFIDWDGTFHEMEENFYDSYNEIDVVLMSGLVPTFISCKNGMTDESELYKFNTVATRFGGPYVKKFLIASYADRNEHKRAYLQQRARDMGITLLLDVDDMDRDQLVAWLCRLWS